MEGDILENYVELETSSLNQKEKEEIMKMLYRYKEAFNLRDETGTCPTMEVEIDVADKTPFFIRTYHVKRTNKCWIKK